LESIPVAVTAACTIEPRPSADEDEESLLARCRTGDRAALRSLYDRYARVVMANARRLGLPAHEAEDVAQEVFSATFRDLERVEPGSLSAWLFRLTSNRVNDRFRRRRIREVVHRWLGAGDPPESPDRPDRIALRHDAERRVGHILSRMSQKKRDVFALFELQGLSGDEIAAQLEIPVDTVWTRLHHARIEFAKVGRSLEMFEDTHTTGAAS
jgi:RNA polymerase sigma-70 factor (ECF subfamily)